jgi:serine/threonine-protein kinase
MPLSPGDTLGPYDVTAQIGAGGMGEVYRAYDPRLNRDVAIKISAEQFSDRFTREARAIASLNHTNVCHLYDVGPNYLVMEHVEGQDLQGPMSFDDALPIIQQLIDGIEAAHERNIIHRDLKPANIKVTPDGVVKILDFGLAKAMDPGLSRDGDPAHSPTMTMGATQAGTILGTAAYMAPEQAKGKTADKRSDIWSFGVIVYELLTGQRMFAGESAVEILGKVLNREPDLSAAPERVHTLLAWCLEKDRKKRLAAIGDARRMLETSASAPASAAAQPSRLPWGVAAALAVGLIATLVWWAPWSTPQPQDRPLVRLSVDLGPDADRDVRVSAVLSPDGSRIVYTAKGPVGFHQLYTRRLDQPTATLLTPEAVRQTNPIFSPNGEWVAYWTGARLMKVPSQGGEPVAIGATPTDFSGASWGDDDNIIMGSSDGLWRVPSRGGTAEFLKAKGTPGTYEWPHVLPGSRAVVVMTALAGQGTADGFDIDVVQLATGEKKNLVHGGYWPRYVPTSGATGHLVYLREGVLYGVGFDPRSLTLSGTPTPLLNDVAADSSLITVGGQFAFSNTGTFVYISGKPQDATYSICWLDPSGKATPVVTQPGAYGSPRVSPDGKLLAYTAATNRGSRTGSDLWVYDLARSTPTQLTFAGEVVDEVAWARDSKHLVYQDGKSLWWIRSDGAGQKQLLLDGKELGPTPLGPRPFSFGPSRLAFSPSPGGLPDIWTLPVDVTDPERPKPGEPEALLKESFVEVDPSFSPDGKFVAYTSNESGESDVFVRPFPGPGGKWKVSTARGSQFPTWSPATREIFFLGPDDRIMVASYTIQGDSFSAGIPRVWSPTPIRRHGVQLNFDIAPDGKRVIMFPQPAADAPTGNLHATFLLNFFDEIRRKIPVQ